MNRTGNKKGNRLLIFFIIVTGIIVCTVLFLVLFSQQLNKSNYVKEMESKILYANRSYAGQFDDHLRTMQVRVNTLAEETGAFITYEDYQNGTADYASDKKKIDRMIHRLLDSEEGISSLYVTFNPKLFPNRQEVWYIKDNNGNVEWVDSASRAKTWLLESNPNTIYFYHAMKYGSYWGGYEWETILQRYVTTYTHVIIDKNGQKIGIAGSDIASENITATVENLKLDEKGSSYLFDAKNNCIAHSKNADVDEKMLATLNQKAKKESDTMKVSYVDSDNGRLIVASSELVNHWHLVFTVPEKVATDPMWTSMILVYVLAGLVILLFVMMNFLFFRRSLKPIVTQIEDQETFMIVQSRQASIGQMMGNTLHQIKQPINSANITLSNLREDIESDTIDKEELMRHISYLQKSMDSIYPIISDFTDFLKPETQKTRVQISREFDRAQSLIETQLKLDQIYPAVDIPEDIYVWGYPNELCQCMLALLTNAVEAIEADEKPNDRRIEAKAFADDGQVVFTLFNSGPPVDEEIGQQIFDPHFTTKASTGGTGIGLYLTYQIVTDHFLGTIDYRNQEDGVAFEIRIPQEADAEEIIPHEPEKGAGDNGFEES